MTAEQLRNSILQEAISGRLVPQDPNDEPASELLARIREEKARLVKEGKLKKKDLVETPITDEEKPFEIPSSWEWVRYQDIADCALGKTKNPNQVEGELCQYLCSINVYWDSVRLNVLKEMLFSDTDKQKYSVEKGDMLICEGGDAGRSAIYEGNISPIYYQNALHRVRFYGGICTRFFLYQMELYKKTGLLTDHIKGETIQHFVSTKLLNLPIPLPPLAEQKRIVAKLEELLPIVEQYGKAQKELDELNAALPSRLRQSILQEAISGTLVPQDENDEPVSSSAIIPEDDIPFEIPSTWTWVTMKDCAKIIGGYAFPSASIKGDKGIRVIRISDISEKGFVNKSVVRYNGSDNLEKFKVQPQDILIAMTGGTVGKSLFVKEMDEDMLLNQRVAIIRNNGQYAPYLDMVVKSPHIKSFINDKKNSTNDNISMDDIKNFLVPLPPLAEQARIIAKIEELFAEIDKLSK